MQYAHLYVAGETESESSHSKHVYMNFQIYTRRNYYPCDSLTRGMLRFTDSCFNFGAQFHWLNKKKGNSRRFRIFRILWWTDDMPSSFSFLIHFCWRSSQILKWSWTRWLKHVENNFEIYIFISLLIVAFYLFRKYLNLNFVRYVIIWKCQIYWLNWKW